MGKDESNAGMEPEASDVDLGVMPLVAMKERLQKKFRERKRLRNLKRPVSAPRYDDVYFKGVEWLNKNG